MKSSVAPVNRAMEPTVTSGRGSRTAQSVFRSVADSDGMLHSGMEEGVNDSLKKAYEGR